MSKKKPGPTGEFPDGKLNEFDEGELRVEISIKNDIIVIDFGKPVRWLGLTKEDALQIAEHLTDKANEL